MRIAMLSYHTCPLATLGGKDTGGMNVYVRDLTKQLGAKGIEVDVFTRSQDEHVPHVLHDLGYGNRIVHIRAGPEVPLPKEKLIDHLPAFVQGIKDFSDAKSIHYDLIHSHYWMSGIAAISLKNMWNVPIVHMFHTLGIMKKRVARSVLEKEGEYRLKGEYEVLKDAERIIAATLAELAQLQWLYQADTNKIVVIPPGVDISHFYPIPPDEAKEFIGVPPCNRMILYVGRIEPLKGIDTLIKAIQIIDQRKTTDDNPFCLTIIGGDPDINEAKLQQEMNRLQSLRKRLGLEEFVAFLGQRSQDTLPYYYSAAEVVVVPSHYESFGMVALEAMACGKPVIASQVGGLAFLVQDGVTGYTVPVDEPDTLADALMKLMNNDILRKEMGKNGYALAQNYRWELITSKILDLYQEVIKNYSNTDQK